MYAYNAVVNILTGKAITQGIRGHLINPELDEAADLYKNLIQDTVKTDDVCQADVQTRIRDSFQRDTNSF